MTFGHLRLGRRKKSALKRQQEKCVQISLHQNKVDDLVSNNTPKVRNPLKARIFPSTMSRFGTELVKALYIVNTKPNNTFLKKMWYIQLHKFLL